MSDIDDRTQAFKTAQPGTVVSYLPSRDHVTLDRRKDDDSGWWLREGGGLADHAFATGPWELETS